MLDGAVLAEGAGGRRILSNEGVQLGSQGLRHPGRLKPSSGDEIGHRFDDDGAFGELRAEKAGMDVGPADRDDVEGGAGMFVHNVVQRTRLGPRDAPPTYPLLGLLRLDLSRFRGGWFARRRTGLVL